ncbi:MAG: hypothetical protein ISS35_00015 [Kiritimatiellae bacterium]|nr:hypothetical protein [Kiritimatiellia bacterium]
MNGTNALLAVTILAGLIVPASTLAEDNHACHSCAAGEIEFGFSVGYVRLDEDREHHEETEHDDHDEHYGEHETTDDGIALHVHVGKRLGEDGILAHLSLGIAGEVIFADHEHYALMGFASIYPWRGLVLSVGPGIEWAEHEGEWESEFSTHLETAYVFDVGAWHIGPVVDYSKTDHGEHFTAGIHFGVHL